MQFLSTENSELYRRFALKTFIMKDKFIKNFLSVNPELQDTKVLSDLYNVSKRFRSYEVVAVLGKTLVRHVAIQAFNSVTPNNLLEPFLHYFDPSRISVALTDEEQYALLSKCNIKDSSPGNFYFLVVRNMITDMLNIKLEDITRLEALNCEVWKNGVPEDSARSVGVQANDGSTLKDDVLSSQEVFQEKEHNTVDAKFSFTSEPSEKGLSSSNVSVNGFKENHHDNANWESSQNISIERYTPATKSPTSVLFQKNADAPGSCETFNIEEMCTEILNNENHLNSVQIIPVKQGDVDAKSQLSLAHKKAGAQTTGSKVTIEEKDVFQEETTNIALESNEVVQNTSLKKQVDVDNFKRMEEDTSVSHNSGQTLLKVVPNFNWNEKSLFRNGSVSTLESLNRIKEQEDVRTQYMDVLNESSIEELSAKNQEACTEVCFDMEVQTVKSNNASGTSHQNKPLKDVAYDSPIDKSSVDGSNLEKGSKNNPCLFGSLNVANNGLDYSPDISVSDELFADLVDRIEEAEMFTPEYSENLEFDDIVTTSNGINPKTALSLTNRSNGSTTFTNEKKAESKKFIKKRTKKAGSRNTGHLNREEFSI